MMHLSRNRGNPWASPQPSQPLSCPPQFPAHTQTHLSFPPTHCSQLPLAAHHLLQEAFGDWKSGPWCPPESLEGSGHKQGWRSWVSFLAVSVAPRAHSRHPNSHTASCSLPTLQLRPGSVPKVALCPIQAKVTSHSLWTREVTECAHPAHSHTLTGL